MKSVTLDAINFSAILASSVHDMKNSLGTINALIKRLHSEQQPQLCLAQLDIETSQMNSHLMQLLSLYKIEQGQFHLLIDEYSITDILEEIKAHKYDWFKLNNIYLDIENNDENACCYCDFENIINVLCSALNNAQRYAQHKIRLSTGIENNYRYFSIEDDGPGFNTDILNGHNKVNFNTNTTGLGLYFNAIIADLHQSHDKRGYIEVNNDSYLGGAKFSLFLP